MLYAGQGVCGRGTESPRKKNPKKQEGFALLKRDSKTHSKSSKLRDSTASCATIPIEDFEADEFGRLMEFLHCGRCTLVAHSIVGLIAAAEYFAVDDLQFAASGFMNRCITIDNVCHYLCEAEKYIQFKSIKTLVPKLLEFTAINAREILGRVSFCSLPQHVVRLILARKDLNATEWQKFTAVLTWGNAYCDKNPGKSLKESLEPMVDCIEFSKIPTMQLMQEVRQMDIVPDHVIMKALAYQADPSSVEKSQHSRPPKQINTDIALNNNNNVTSLNLNKQADHVTVERLIKG